MPALLAVSVRPWRSALSLAPFVQRTTEPHSPTTRLVISRVPVSAAPEARGHQRNREWIGPHHLAAGTAPAIRRCYLHTRATFGAVRGCGGGSGQRTPIVEISRQKLWRSDITERGFNL